MAARASEESVSFAADGILQAAMNDSLSGERLTIAERCVCQDENGLPRIFQHVRRPQGRDPASDDDGIVFCLTDFAHGISSPKNSAAF